MLHFLNPIFPLFFNQYTWRRNVNDKTIFLTFDDGPIPEVTDWVLTLLRKYNIKATFFCIGDNIKKHPTIFQNCINAGHQIGNHTFNHINGWKYNTLDYINNIELCRLEIIKNNTSPTKLFRPPYGKITTKQSREIIKLGYEIIMWSAISEDYNNNIEPQECLENALNHLKPGSIVVFHDSLKAEKNLRYALPLFIEAALAQGYSFAVL